MAKKAAAEPEVAELVKTPEQLRVEGLLPIRVHLHASTPLTHNNVLIWAISPAAAKRKFCEINGITDSVCDWSIDEDPEGGNADVDGQRIIADS